MIELSTAPTARIGMFTNTDVQIPIVEIRESSGVPASTPTDNTDRKPSRDHCRPGNLYIVKKNNENCRDKAEQYANVVCDLGAFVQFFQIIILYISSLSASGFNIVVTFPFLFYHLCSGRKARAAAAHL